MKINLGFSQKRYSRDMSFDNNTTFGFGDVQPVMCQMMLPDSDIKVSTKQLVRLAPLIAPSFARVKLFTTARFVPFTEVFEPFESLLSNIAYTSKSGRTFIPSSLPSIPQNLLFLSLLPYCTWSVIKTTVSTDHTSKISKYLFNKFVGFYHPAWDKFCLNSSYQTKRKLTSAESDFILKLPDYESLGNTAVVAFRLTNTGRRLRKIYLGLGYDILSLGDFKADSLNVSLLPLLAFYKAYFDTYAPQREISFLQTDCYKFISFLSDLPNASFASLGSNSDDAISFVFNFLSFVNFNLSDSLYTAYDDYISVHTRTPLTSSTSSLSVLGSTPHNVGVGTTSKVPESLPTSDNPLDNVLLKSLKIFTNFVSKDSVIGKRMSLWVRNHFNADISNQLFKETNFVGSSVLDLQINDVFSTSDTADSSDNSGEHLGAYAGKGIGFGNGNYRYHSQVHGYFIIFACIAPESRTFQGTDPTLLALDRFTLPQPEFDALGYEITDSRVFIGCNDLYSGSPTHKAFGYVPRYTGFKYRKNICNGSMSLRSVASSLMPYYLDRILIQNYPEVSTSDGTALGIITNDLPTASTEWRYITKYPWLSNFNRLFIQDVVEDDILVGDTETVIQEDNFICQMVLNVSLKDSLKPLKSSYDTFDDERDTDTSSVNAE